MPRGVEIVHAHSFIELLLFVGQHPRQGVSCPFW